MNTAKWDADLEHRNNIQLDEFRNLNLRSALKPPLPSSTLTHTNTHRHTQAHTERYSDRRSPSTLESRGSNVQSLSLRSTEDQSERTR